LTGDRDGAGDLLIIETGEVDLHRGAYPNPFLVDLGNQHDNLQVIGIHDLERVAARAEALPYLDVEDIDGPRDIGIDAGEINLLLVDLYPGLRLIDGILRVDEVHFGADLFVPEILAPLVKVLGIGQLG